MQCPPVTCLQCCFHFAGALCHVAIFGNYNICLHARSNVTIEIYLVNDVTNFTLLATLRPLRYVSVPRGNHSERIVKTFFHQKWSRIRMRSGVSRTAVGVKLLLYFTLLRSMASRFFSTVRIVRNVVWIAGKLTTW